VARGADVLGGVVENEVFEMDEFAFDPQRGAGAGNLAARDEARTDLRTADSLSETGESLASSTGRIW